MSLWASADSERELLEGLFMDPNSELDVGAAPLDVDAEFGGREARQLLERKLLRKLDMRMSILVLIFTFNYVDRNNASAARLEGFETDLHLKGQQFDTLLSTFYASYMLMQIPSNMLLNYIGKPSIYLPTSTVLWGVISCLTGVTRNFTQALLTRFFLGFVEAAFFPGALFLLSKCNAFGSLMASGILSGMQGKLGHAAWRWLFFIEGALTIVVAIIAVFVLPDFPQYASRFLSPEEMRLAKLRMQEDVGIGDDDESESKDSHFPGLFEALSDWRVYWLAFALASLEVSLSFSAFFPTLTETLGYPPTVTLLLCVPPWIFATLVSFAVSRHSDVTEERCFHIVIPLFIGIIGFIIAISTMRLAARYVALFLIAQSYAGFACFLTWTSNTFARPPSKCAVALAFINAFSHLGSIAGSYVWQKFWGPSYSHSYVICISAQALCIAMCIVFRQVLSQENKRLKQQEISSDRSGGPGYRYLL